MCIGTCQLVCSIVRLRNGILLSILIAVLACLTACSESDQVNLRQTSPSGDGVIGVQSDDPEMIAAMETAREHIDEFWTAMDNSGADFGGLLKVYFTDDADSDQDGEHMWVNVTGRDETTITGVLLSSPLWLESVSEGDLVTFPHDDVSDWLFVEDGLARGAYTVRLLRSRMSAAEREAHDAGYPFRFE